MHKEPLNLKNLRIGENILEQIRSIKSMKINMISHLAVLDELKLKINFQN